VEDEVVIEPIGSGLRRKGRYSDTFFRHKIVILAPLIICTIAGLGLASKSHKSFEASTSLWADTAAPAPSTVQDPSGYGTVSGNMQGVLFELLGTQPFQATVAKDLGLPANTNLGGLHKSVLVSTPGPQLLTITAKEATPQAAVAVTKGVSSAFVSTIGQFLGQRQQSTVSYDYALVQSTKANLVAIEAQMAQYAPTSTQYAQLDEQRDLAANAYSAANTTYTQAQAAQGAVTTAGVVFPYGPTSPAVAVASKKALIFAAGGGILAGILLMVAVLCALVSSDRSVRRQTDIEDLLALPVIGSIDTIPKRRTLGRGSAA
jgi:uncharacterized protein involved in exopolysaccharide biosynthesis